MHKSLFVFGVLGALLTPPAECDLISVCVENDNDLRVDCLIASKPNKINSYEFSWSAGTKEFLIHTNVSGSAAEAKFKDKSYVEELEPSGYRMTLSGFTESLPHNTTYMCKVSGDGAQVTWERDKLPVCSAVFLRSSWSGILCLLLFVYQTHS